MKLKNGHSLFEVKTNKGLITCERIKLKSENEDFNIDTDKRITKVKKKKNVQYIAALNKKNAIKRFFLNKGSAELIKRNDLLNDFSIGLSKGVRYKQHIKKITGFNVLITTATYINNIETKKYKLHKLRIKDKVGNYHSLIQELYKTVGNLSNKKNVINVLIKTIYSHSIINHDY